MEKAVNASVEKEKPGLIFCYRLRMAPYVEKYAGKIPAVIDIVDSLGLYMERNLPMERNFLRKLYLLIDKKRVEREEKRLALSPFKSVILNYEEIKCTT
jgi:hypothetical protein